MGTQVAIVGLGSFGQNFVELFQHHPGVDGVTLCDLRSHALTSVAKKHQIEGCEADFEAVLLRPDIDAVAIFTQRWSHAQLAIKALKAGKHVYSAVPAAISIEELDELVKTVEETGLIYALGETSYYRPQNIYCRERFARGDFGEFVYGEGHYYHNMAHWFYMPFSNSNGKDWKRFASIPPMLYPTHSICHVLGVSMSRFTKVSCFGWIDNHPDGIFNKQLSAFDNAWSNQSALFRSADGGMARINEFRRTATGESRQNIMGTHGSYEETPNPVRKDFSVSDQFTGNSKQRGACIASWENHHITRSELKADGTYNFDEAPFIYQKQKEDISWIHDISGVEISDGNLHGLDHSYLGKKHLGINRLHPYWRLPKEYIGLANGHCGSHQFLVHDFIEAMSHDKLPPNHVWFAARLNAPGIIAHESCKRDGECLEIPDFGLPPSGKACLDPLMQLR